MAGQLKCWAYVAALTLVLIPSSSQALEQVLSDFNQSGFDYVFDGFVTTNGPDSVRLTDLNDGWGGAGNFVGSLDLSSLNDGRFVIDLTPEVTNGVNRFTLEMYDDSPVPRSGKWDFNLLPLTPGQPTTLVSNSVLSLPEFGQGDFQNLDLSRIQSWQVLGQYGSPDTFDISFDQITISNEVAPPPPYAGAEPDAAWRAVAQSRIEQNRKADLTVTVVDAVGNVIPNATVDVAMQKHEFGFGTAAQAFRLRDSNPTHDIYKAKLSEFFNQATIENNFKWPAWEGEWGNLWTQQGAQAAVDWLESQEMGVRGHVMVWPGESNLPADIQQLLSDDNLTQSEQQTVRNRLAAHIASLGAATNGKFTAWDVINETRTNHDLMDQLDEGNLAMVDWFSLARQAVGDTKLYLNEYGILDSAGAIDTPNQQQYYDTIQDLKNEGAPIDGIGIQGHFTEETLTGPEQVWAILDRFEQLGLEMQITEFDFNTTDEALQAQYTRDFMTAIFSHEAMSDFIQWGFWEDAHWRPEAAMFRSDWSIKPNGEAYSELVFDEWWTDETIATDDEGIATTRGFKGDYLVTATVGDETNEVEAVITTDGASIIVTLALLQGDYNEDGKVDAADYTVWRDSFGSTAVSTERLAADGNNNGTIDAADYEIWQANFGASLEAETSSTVPEPSGGVLMLFAMTGLGDYKRKLRNLPTPARKAAYGE